MALHCIQSTSAHNCVSNETVTVRLFLRSFPSWKIQETTFISIALHLVTIDLQALSLDSWAWVRCIIRSECRGRSNEDRMKIEWLFFAKFFNNCFFFNNTLFLQQYFPSKGFFNQKIKCQQCELVPQSGNVHTPQMEIVTKSTLDSLISSVVMQNIEITAVLLRKMAALDEKTALAKGVPPGNHSFAEYLQCNLLCYCLLIFIVSLWILNNVINVIYNIF